MSDIREVDVLVIGAGPAGSTAARWAAKDGAKTLLIDRKSEIGTPKRCAEGITSEAIEKLGLEIEERCISRHIDKARIISPDNTEALFANEEIEAREVTGVILERKVFDKHLAMDAIRCGSEVMLKTEALGMKRCDEGFLVDVRVFNRDIIQIKARIVIAADGPEACVSRWAGINTKVPQDEMESGAQYELTNLRMKDSQTIEFYFGSIAPGGYVWIFPKGYDTANVGIDVNPTKATKPAIEYLDEFIKNSPVTRDAQAVEINIGGNPLCGVYDEIIADNFMLAGDAAGCVNPVTGGGIDTAIESGMMAGKTAAQAVKENDCSKENLKEYREYVDKNIKGKFKKLTHIRDFLYGLDDEDINEYVKIIASANFETLTITSLVKALVKSSPRKLLKLGKILF